LSSLIGVELLGRFTTGGREDHVGDWRRSPEERGNNTPPTRSTRGAGDWNGFAAVIALRRMLKALPDKICN
jgi:hypothetical protein